MDLFVSFVLLGTVKKLVTFFIVLFLKKIFVAFVIYAGDCEVCGIPHH
jgi:hypothetical protein